MLADQCVLCSENTDSCTGMGEALKNINHWIKDEAKLLHKIYQGIAYLMWITGFRLQVIVGQGLTKVMGKTLKSEPQLSNT